MSEMMIDEQCWKYWRRCQDNQDHEDKLKDINVKFRALAHKVGMKWRGK